MTENELIEAERKAVDSISDLTAAKRKKLYAKMRAFSLPIPNRTLPNDVPISETWLPLRLRALDLAGQSPEAGFYLPKV